MTAPNKSYNFSIADTLDISTALASLSQFLNNKFNKMNNDPQNNPFSLAWMDEVIPVFQSTYPVRVILIIDFGPEHVLDSELQPSLQPLSCSRIWWPFDIPDESSGLSTLEVNACMECVAKIDVDELAQDSRECDICKIGFTNSAGLQVEADAMSSGVSPELAFKAQEASDNEQVIPETPVKLACGHIYGENCLRSWISGHAGRIQPTCPTCRAVIEGIRDDEESKGAEVMITLDGLRGLAVMLGINPNRD